MAEELTLHAYVYLFLVVKYVGHPDPNANIPRVEFPAADWHCDAAVADDAEETVSDANVYFSLVASLPPPPTVVAPKANIPIAPGAKAIFAEKPNAVADIAPRVIIVGIIIPYANLVCDANTVNAALPVFTIVYVYISMLDALPNVGAVPPCHFGVTDPPSTCTALL